MTMLAGQILADERHFQELQQADLQMHARMKGNIPRLGASLMEWRDIALENDPRAYTKGPILMEETFRNTPIGLTEERMIDLHHRLVMLRKGQVRGHGPFLQEPVSDELFALKNAAESKNRLEFARLATTITWRKYPSKELTGAIDFALALDMVQVARELAQEGRKLFPRDERIHRAAGVLSPPLFMRTQPVQITDFEVSQQWLNENSSHYRGLWVAVRAGTRLGSAPTLKELLQRIGTGGRTPNTLIVKVLS
jgi:hypothetical protein